MTTEAPVAGMPTLPATGTTRRSFAWMDEALCAQIGPDDWFSSTNAIVTAQRVCSDCPVRVECGAHAVAFEAEEPNARRYGVWGGRSGGARKRAEAPIVGNPKRDSQIIRLAALGWDAVRIADEVGCEERTVYRVTARAREAS